MARVEQDILDVFKRNDKSGTGKISLRALKSVLENVGCDDKSIGDVLTGPHITSKYVEYEAWLGWLMREKSGALEKPARGDPRGRCEGMFNCFDHNHDGLLNVSELGELLKHAFPEETISQEDQSLLMKDLDSNQDGQVGINEIRAFLRSYDANSKHLYQKSALIIVDVQNDFITGALANPFNAQEIVPIINSIRDCFDMVVISYDWHPQEHCSFVESVNANQIAVKEDRRDYNPLEMVTLLADADRVEHAQMLYPRHAVQHSHGSQCPPDLVVKDTDASIYKGTKKNIDSYSAFFDNIKANDTGLTKLLEDQGITHVYVCGLVFDICVKSTALHGAEMGFHTSVICDASKPFVEAEVENTKEQLVQAGCKLVTSDQVADLCKGGSTLSLKEYLEQIRPMSKAKSVHNMLNMSGPLCDCSSPTARKDVGSRLCFSMVDSSL
jgi:nicotinamidase-related amidase/Ca2+-binding EF-hand superfamily protein